MSIVFSTYFTSLIPLFIHFLRCFYFNILLKSVIGVGCLCLLSSVDDADQYIGATEGKILIIHCTFKRLKTQPNLRTALGMLFTDFRTWNKQTKKSSAVLQTEINVFSKCPGPWWNKSPWILFLLIDCGAVTVLLSTERHNDTNIMCTFSPVVYYSCSRLI